MISNTVRRVDPALIEAAQTLGARGWRLLRDVVIPASITGVYTDMRILLGWAWTYLIVAEVVGTMSGITYFINQQARYRNFPNVYAAIVMIGIIGFSTDLVLAWIGNRVIPVAADVATGQQGTRACPRLTRPRPRITAKSRRGAHAPPPERQAPAHEHAAARARPEAGSNPGSAA